MKTLALSMMVALFVVPVVQGRPQHDSRNVATRRVAAETVAGQLSRDERASVDALLSPRSAVAARPASSAPAAAADDSLEAKGKMLYASYGCSDCHGMNGEGTDAAPDLTATHLSPEEIAAFLEKPSPDARGAGMPTIAADSPDLKPLVAYVVSLKKAK